MEAGYLPNLSRLVARGSHGILYSTIPPLSPAAWSSFATGMNPGKHGILDHIYRRDGTYEHAPVNAKRRTGTSVWSIVGQHGKHVGLVNIPLTYPPGPVHGYMITGMYTPSEEVTYTYPPELKIELKQAIGGYQVFGQRSKLDLDLALDGLFEAMDRRFKAADYLLSTKPWDLFILVLQETDIVQHKFWKYMDPSHPGYVPDGPARYKTAILDIYRRVDEGLGDLLEYVDDDTVFILMSDHGAGPLHKRIYLNNWLLREGFLRLKSSLIARLKYIMLRLGYSPTELLGFISRISPRLTDEIIKLVKKKSFSNDSSLHRAFLSNADIDWPRTKAYALGSNLAGISINVQGREPEGCVEPGEEYQAVREALRHCLLQLQDEDTGERIVKAVYYREEIYHGPNVGRAPDILFDTVGDRYAVFGIHEFASSSIMEKDPWFSGTHRSDGILLMSGKDIRSGVELADRDLVDLAPTILYLLGCKIPEEMDGDLVIQAVSEQYLEENPPQFSDYQRGETAEEISGFSTEEEEVIEDRLRSLGYLG